MGCRLLCFPEMAFTGEQFLESVFHGAISSMKLIGYFFENAAAISLHLERPRTGATSQFCSGTGFATFDLPPPLRTMSLAIYMDLNPHPPNNWTSIEGPYELADVETNHSIDIRFWQRNRMINMR